MRQGIIVAGGICAFIALVTIIDFRDRRRVHGGNGVLNDKSKGSNNQHQGANHSEPSPTEPRSYEHGWQPKDEEHKRAERRYWRRSNAVSALTLLITLVAVGAAGTSAWLAFNALQANWKQAESVEQQVGIMADQEQRQLRAYLTVDIASLTDFSLNDEPYAVATIVNMGQTPAYETAWLAGLGLDTYPMKGPLKGFDDCSIIMSRPDARRWFIGKRVSITRYTGWKVVQPDLDAIKGNAQAMYRKHPARTTVTPD